MKSKIKRILLFSLLAINLYLGIGAISLNDEILQRLYIFTSGSYKHGNTDQDKVAISSEGPIIIYENGKILKYQISSKNKKISISKTEITKNESLECFVDETKDNFTFNPKKNRSCIFIQKIYGRRNKITK